MKFTGWFYIWKSKESRLDKSIAEEEVGWATSPTVSPRVTIGIDNPHRKSLPHFPTECNKGPHEIKTAKGKAEDTSFTINRT